MPAVILLLVMGLVLGLVIGIVVKLFGAEVDPRLEEVEEALPGSNCGACGFAGCAAFAEALVTGKSDNPGMCTSCDEQTVGKLAGLLGLTATMQTPMVAVVRCSGDNDKARRGGLYNGVSDCGHASLVAGGAKACLHGCLGLGTCARACPVDAIEMTPAGLAVVHPDICTGCGKCVRTCPRKLIILAPKSAQVHVLCNSPEKGAAKRDACTVSCIGCRKCVKEAGDDHMAMDGFLARVNYDNPPSSAEIAAVCPTKCLQPSLIAEAPAPHEDEQQEVVNA